MNPPFGAQLNYMNARSSTGGGVVRAEANGPEEGKTGSSDRSSGWKHSDKPVHISQWNSSLFYVVKVHTDVCNSYFQP